MLTRLSANFKFKTFDVIETLANLSMVTTLNSEPASAAHSRTSSASEAGGDGEGDSMRGDIATLQDPSAGKAVGCSPVPISSADCPRGTNWIPCEVLSCWYSVGAQPFSSRVIRTLLGISGALVK